MQIALQNQNFIQRNNLVRFSSNNLSKTISFKGADDDKKTEEYITMFKKKMSVLNSSEENNTVAADFLDKIENESKAVQKKS